MTSAGGKPSLREALEAALVEDPGDRATHSAYADLLMEQGDPRGEFGRVQLALEDPALPAALHKKHQAQWLGELAPFLLGEDSQVTFQFARGWLDRLHLGSLTVNLARA